MKMLTSQTRQEKGIHLPIFFPVSRAALCISNAISAKSKSLLPNYALSNPFKILEGKKEMNSSCTVS